MDPNSLKGNPLLIDKLNPELGARVVKAVEDVARAGGSEATGPAAEKSEKKKSRKGDKKKG